MFFCSAVLLYAGVAHKKHATLLSSCNSLVPYCIDEAMLDPQKIPLYRVKQAYCLNELEAQGLLHELSLDRVFPYELWQKAYITFWKYPAAECSRLYEVENPPFPETHFQSQKYFPTETHAKGIVDFFFEMARRISVKDLENGFDYIVESTYDNKLAVNEYDRRFLFYHLAQVEKNIATASRTKGVKDISEQLSAPNVLFELFPDTIVVDKIAAVHYLSVVQKFPFDHEVKGITRALVDSVINAHREKEAATVISTLLPEQPQTPPSTGSRKDITRINATRQICEEIAEELLREKQQFENSKTVWKQSLLFDNGKSNWKTFIHAVETRLGQPPHHDTARAEWNKVSDRLKHNGRVREQ